MSRQRRFIHFLKRLGQIGLILLLIVLIIIITPLVGVAIECRAFAGGQLPPPILATVGAIRPEDQTYLTLPEWYIVFNADEYAAFVADNPPSHFPYFRSIGQYWTTYYDVCAITRDKYAFNTSYHLTLVVIGTSFTLENVVRGLYEGSLGRLAELTSSSDLTEEDRYAQQVAKEYGDFIHTIPWYEFPYPQKLDGLWAETDLQGPNIVRKWERKFALSVEYWIKSRYAELLKQGTAAAYATEIVEIEVQAKGITPEILAQNPELRRAEAIDEEIDRVLAPRYEAFTRLAPSLTAQGVEFVEIAGNDEILISVLTDQAWSYDLPAGRVLFEMPILSQPGRKRVAINVPLPVLHLVINDLIKRDEVQLEHIYDY